MFIYFITFITFRNLKISWYISLNLNCIYFDNMEYFSSVVFYLFLRLTLDSRSDLLKKKKKNPFHTVNLMVCLCISSCFIRKHSISCRCGTMSLSVRLFTVQVNPRDCNFNCVLNGGLFIPLDVFDLYL